PAQSATSHAQPLSSPISSTTTYRKLAEITSVDNDYASNLADSFRNSPPWPSPEDDLHTLGQDSTLVAQPGYTIIPGPWYTYCEGYRAAAGLIAKALTADMGANRDKDVLIHPFLMLWRHYTELQLKSLCAYMRSRSGADMSTKLSHRLDHLWRETRHLIESSPYGLPEELPDVERIILQLHRIDPTSQHARYPMTHEGTPTFEGLGPVDLGNFHHAMEAVANFLETLPDVLEQAYNFQAEMNAEHYNDMYGY
ncbi:hypothetical protein, partial [Nonomuraea fuscirosea]|uniref:hypothetical protein n=1 Tax=Nonomuraea fuscirosea TaxID=1291556 RepID=UPI0034197D7D